MKIEKNTAVTLHYKVMNTQGQLLEKNSGPLVYLHGGYGNIFPKIEDVLDDQIVGYQTIIELQPDEAFGLRDENLVQVISKSQFPPGVKVGGQLQGNSESGHPQTFTVMKIKGDQIMLDGNHPMAGKILRFSLTVQGIRAATEEEIAHGHVHGEHGHHH